MYRNILVPLDGSELSEKALPAAKMLAQVNQAQLILIQAAGAHVPEARAYLTKVASELVAEGFAVDTLAVSGPPAQAILLEAQRRPADVVVMCTHGRSGVGRVLFGSVAEAVLSHSTVPVFLVRTTTDAQSLLRPKMMVPLDGSPFAEAALTQATALSRTLSAPLVLLDVVCRPPEPCTSIWNTSTTQLQRDQELAYQLEERVAHRYVDGVVARLQGEGYPVEGVVCRGSACQGILEHCAELGVTMVVMATHGRTGVKRLAQGSVAFSVLSHSNFPLLLVHPSEKDVAQLAHASVVHA